MPYLDILSPDSGIINVCKGDTIHFQLKYFTLVDKVQINTNLFSNPDPNEWATEEEHEELLKLQQYIPYKANDSLYTFSYVADSTKLRYIDVLIDYNRILRIKINMLK